MNEEILKRYDDIIEAIKLVGPHAWEEIVWRVMVGGMASILLGFALIICAVFGAKWVWRTAIALDKYDRQPVCVGVCIAACVTVFISFILIVLGLVSLLAPEGEAILRIAGQS